VLNMKAGDLTHDDGRVWYAYRGKGGKQGKRELPQPAYAAIVAALAAFGIDIATVAADASLWPARRGDARDHERHLLRQPATVLPARRTEARGRPHLSTLGCQAPPRRRREHRGREPVPRSLVARRDH